MKSANIINKPFVKNEWVSHVEGDFWSDVYVSDVDGDVVTVINGNGRPVGKFSPRASDGTFVRIGSPDFEVMPTMIYHRAKVVTPAKAEKRVSFVRKVTGFFK